ncbi:MAG: tRNA (N(6)-L-threonylcarbamoyladenosine(37)-C(2))-methylthiotransferase MtaB, partial [Akkermansiaceae bacterium]
MGDIPPFPFMKVAFHTLGCRLNQSETAVLSNAFERAGYALSKDGKGADVCVVNTCTVTGASDAKCRSSIRRLIRENPEARVAVIGCYAESGFQAISEIEGVDLIVGNQEKLNLLHYLPDQKVEEARVVKDRMLREAFTIDAIGQSTSRSRTSLKVQDGCDFMCSFCIIPFVRGRARGRVFDNLMDEARQLVSQGFKELVLTGVNVGTYDVEGRSLIDIVDALHELDLPRVRISSIEPTTVEEGLLERMNDPGHALVPYLHLPLQSGSDSVLSAMRRRYTRKDYTDYLDFAHSKVNGLSIGTDVLLGSPEESDKDFEATCSLLTDHPLDYAHAFTYSEREGTPDAKKKQIPMEERKRRTNVVRRLSSRKRSELAARHLGEEVEVLVEQHQSGLWEGHLGNYLEVKFEGEEKEAETFKKKRGQRKE